MYFNAEELDYMRTQVATLVGNDSDPLNNPITIPTMSQIPQHPSTPPRRAVEIVESTPSSLQATPRPTNSPAQVPTPVHLQNLALDQATPNRRPMPPSPGSSPPSSPSTPNTPPDSPPPRRRLPSPPPGPPPPSPDPPPPPSPVVLPDPDDEQLAVEEELSNTIEEVRAMRMEDRPTLSKLQTYGSTKALIAKVNIALLRLIPAAINLTDLNHVTYAAGLYIDRKMSPRSHNQNRDRPRTPATTPAWKLKLQKQLNLCRKELNQIKQFIANPTARGRLKNIISRLCAKYHTNTTGLQNTARELEGKIPALAKRIKNQDNKNNSKTQNRQFKTNQKSFYRNLIRDTIRVESPPAEEDLENYWRPLFENDVTHNQEAQWITDIERMNETKPEMPEPEITPESVKRKLASFSNHKKPGIDKIPNFWLKQLTSLHQHYSTCFTRMLRGEEATPPWLTKGDTSLIPKTVQTRLPNKYRPICCLTTTYKLFTGLVADSMYDHLSSGAYLEEEQAGCRRKCLGTKDQLLINKTILEDCRKRHKNLSMAWIDYQKAYDSVPHSWMLRCLELYKIHPKIIQTLAAHMQMWQTSISLSHSKGKITIPEVKIRRGIFQGDSLSPLIFCLAIDPLSKLLKKCRSAYNLSQGRRRDPSKNINHLLFMDDLKLYASSDNELHQLLQIVHTFSNDIGMKFGLDKCAKCTLRAGKKTHTENMQLDNNTDIRDLEEHEPYKYLGIEENDTIQHAKMREKISKEYVRRVRKICKTQLTNKNKVTAINQLAMPVITYSFGIIDWPQRDINRLDVKTRKMLTLHRVIYRHQCLPRLYLPRGEGGLGLSEINHQHRATIVSTGQYLKSSRNSTLEMVYTHQQTRASKTTSNTQLAEHFGPECISDEAETPNKPATDIARSSRKKFTKTFHKKIREEWTNHQRAKYFQKELSQEYIDKEGSLDWLKSGALHYDQERIIMAAQDLGLMTNAFKNMCGLSDNNRCRFCHTELESVSHLTSSCKVLMGDGYYTTRHDGVCKYLHWTICKTLNIQCSSKSWEHQPERTVGNETYTIHYDYVIPTATYLENAALKPDIVIWDKKDRVATLIEVSVPCDSGLNRAEREKITKYQGLMYDMKRNWNLREITIIPVIIGATGLMKKNFKNLMKKIPGKPSAKEVQTIALKGTARILKRALGWSQ